MDDTARSEQIASAHTRRWAFVRLALGLGQMSGAVVSFYLLAQTGVNELSLAAAVATCLCTTVSVLLFGSRKRRPRE